MLTRADVEPGRNWDTEFHAGVGSNGEGDERGSCGREKIWKGLLRRKDGVCDLCVPEIR